MRNQWFIIQTLSGQETRSKTALKNASRRGNAGLCQGSYGADREGCRGAQPEEDCVQPEAVAGLRFVDMILLDDENRIIEKPWYFIKETQGVIVFERSAAATPTEEVDAIKVQISASEETEKPKVNLRWRNGQD